MSSSGRVARLLRSVANVFDQVSTRPTRQSYVWGGRPSPLPFAFFHGLYLLRLLSPLQWFKFVVRRRTRRPRGTTNLRPDFPSAYTEGYFLVVLSLAAIAYWVVGTDGTPERIWFAMRVLMWVFIVECFTWIVYYLLLRNFLETNYTIFHPAEYLLTFPVVVSTQLLLVAVATQHGVMELLAAVVGSPILDSPLSLTVSLLALFYFGVAISVLLTSHPGIRVRPSQNIVVIGAGEVTCDRIVPALFELGYRGDDLQVVTLDDASISPSEVDAQRRLRDEVAVVRVPHGRVLDVSLRERSPTIVASPTFTHLGHVLRLANAGVPFAVEKPIVASPSERAIIARNPGLMENGFALSYYALEKALPLTYFYRPLPTYGKFLRSSESDLPTGRALDLVRSQLGALHSIDVTVLEGRDRSPTGMSRLWTELPPTLRPFIETAVHPLLIARHVIGDAPIQWSEAALGKYGPRHDEIMAARGTSVAPTWLFAHGMCSGVFVDVEVGKYVTDDDARREAVLSFANGTAVMNFDTRRLTIDSDGTSLWIEVDSSGGGGAYAKNYAVLMSLFSEFVLNGWGETRFDDLERQLLALEDWDRLCDRVEEADVSEHVYDDTGIPRRTDVTEL